MPIKSADFVYVSLLLSLISLSCDVFYTLGVVKNDSKRRLKVVFTDKIVDDSGLWAGKYRTFVLPAMASKEIYLGFGPPVASKGHKWYLAFYDADTLTNCYHKGQIGGSMWKAILKIDTVTEEQLLDRHVALSYREGEENLLKK